jgi:hypothetical protein
MGRGGRAVRWLRHRTLLGPTISALNREVVQQAAAFQPHLVWAEKPIALQASTWQALRAGGAGLAVYTLDNPFGQMREPSWRLFRENLGLVDAHLVPRRVSLEDFATASGVATHLLDFGYDVDHLFPPPDGWSDADRDIGASFTGSPYDNRARYVETLWREHGVSIDIRGNRWAEEVAPDAFTALVGGEAVYGDGYRERIWRSRICLGFVTHSNRDDTAHRWFEITGAGGFLLAERTERFAECFEEDREAVGFSSIEECAAKIRRYQDDPTAREAIARAGHARALRDGDGYDGRLARALDWLGERFSDLRPPGGSS